MRQKIKNEDVCTEFGKENITEEIKGYRSGSNKYHEYLYTDFHDKLKPMTMKNDRF
jgi:hypothetical protein